MSISHSPSHSQNKSVTASSSVPQTAADEAVSITFRELALSEPVLAALDAVGYESPSPIQAATIPPLLEGRDMLGQAQTGTGKTAAFALPILSKIDLAQRPPQALVLAPTRELAIQVAEAFQKYAAKLPGFHVLPIYGGQSYVPQLAALKRGVHVVVGTPGRIIDHMERGTLDLSQLKTLVLDEADEMLRMGFIDDIETILQKTPDTRQTALFSATMPSQIRRIAQTYLKSPAEVTIKSKTSTATNIRQRYWLVSGANKLDALTRILEAETFDGMIIFARTKAGTQELADKLEARGFSAAALNGDMEQRARERVVARLKSGDLDIVVATDIAARGLDVERISHVFNYDIPTDTESYVHRIGRTGRAGRSGEAILFVSPRERHLLRAIERATRQTVEQMSLPTVATVNDHRITRFMQKIDESLAAGGLDIFRNLVERYERERNIPAVEVAAALARLAQGTSPLLLDASDFPATPPPSRGYSVESSSAPSHHRDRGGDREGRTRHEAPRHEASRQQSVPPLSAPMSPEFQAPPPRAAPRAARHDRGLPSEADAPRPPRHESRPEVRTETRAEPRSEKPARSEPRIEKPAKSDLPPMETFRIEVGHAHKVQPGNIVGAIANETGIDASYIGRIDIQDEHSFIDLPEGMPKEIFRDLQKVWVVGKQLRISRVNAPKTPYQRDASKPAKAGKSAKPRASEG
jgi:ATP-dependent RNA helicase DeaD